MSFLEPAARRYSVRKYSDRPVESAKLDSILHAASLAPTGCNFQPQRILLVDDPSLLSRLRKCKACQFGAPATFVVCYDSTRCWRNPATGEGIGVIDATIVADHMQLEAVEQGLGCCWVASFDRDLLKKELGIPEAYVPVVLIPVGYPAEDSHPSRMHSEHKSAEAFASRNHF